MRRLGPFVLVFAALMGHPADAAAADGVIKGWTDACSFPVAQQLCDFGHWITTLVPNAVNNASTQATQDFFSTLDAWVASAAAWVLDHVVSVVQSTTSVNLDATWFKAHYAQMVSLSALVMLPILAIAAMKAAFVGEGGPLALAVFLYLPFSIVLTFVAIPIVNMIIGSVDWMSTFVGSSLGTDYQSFAHNVATSLGGGAGGASVVAPFVSVIASVVIVLVGLLVIVELLFRNAALYVTAMFIPFALAPIVIPGMSGMAKKLFNGLVAIILLKFFIVTALAVGVAALGAGNQCALGGSPCSGFSTVLAGMVILILAALLPNMLISYLPLVEGAAVAATLSARRTVAFVPQQSSQQIYANIRHGASARLAASHGSPSSGRQMLLSQGRGGPKPPRPPNGGGGGGGSGGGASGSSSGGGGLFGDRSRNGGPVKSLMGRRVKTTQGSGSSTSSAPWQSVGNGGGGLKPRSGSPRTPRSK